VAASRAISMPSASSCGTPLLSRATSITGRYRSTKTRGSKGGRGQRTIFPNHRRPSRLARTFRLTARPCSPLTRKVSSKVNPAGNNPEEGGRAYFSPRVLPPLRLASWVILPSEPLIQVGFGDRQKAITPRFGRPRGRLRTRHRLHRWLRK